MNVHFPTNKGDLFCIVAINKAAKVNMTRAEAEKFCNDMAKNKVGETKEICRRIRAMLRWKNVAEANKSA